MLSSGYANFSCSQSFIECVASSNMVPAGNDQPCSRSGKHNLVISLTAPRLQSIPMLLHPKVRCTLISATHTDSMNLCSEMAEAEWHCATATSRFRRCRS